MKQNNTRNGCKDVFHAYFLKNADYEGKWEFPKLQPINAKPNRLIPFSEAISCHDYNQWVHFYQDDVQFERVWNNPKKYLPILKRYRGVISPDFSMMRDMPLIMQGWNNFRGKSLAFWWQQNGLSVIPNVRTADTRSYEFCFDGIPEHSTICVGSHGYIKISRERYFFQQGLQQIVKKLKPNRIVVYGTAPDEIFSIYQRQGIEIVVFPSSFALSRRREK